MEYEQRNGLPNGVMSFMYSLTIQGFYIKSVTNSVDYTKHSEIGFLSKLPNLLSSIGFEMKLAQIEVLFTKNHLFWKYKQNNIPFLAAETFLLVS